MLVSSIKRFVEESFDSLINEFDNCVNSKYVSDELKIFRSKLVSKKESTIFKLSKYDNNTVNENLYYACSFNFNNEIKRVNKILERYNKGSISVKDFYKKNLIQLKQF